MNTSRCPVPTSYCWRNLLLLLILWSWTSTAVAQRFQQVLVYSVGVGPQGVATTDVNGDGLPDVLVANSGAHSVTVLLNQPAAPGTFRTGTRPLLTNGTFPVALAVGDVNADGQPDIVVGHETSSTISVLLHTADTTLFQLATTHAVGLALPRALALADVNGDSLVDIIVTATAKNQVGVLLNSPKHPGQFQRLVSYASGENHPEALAVRDVNGDGLADLLLSHGASSFVSVLLNNHGRPGTFSAPVRYPGGGSAARGLACEDVNGDGLPDLVLTHLAEGTVTTLLNIPNAPGTFAGGSTVATSAGGPLGVVVGDVTGDKQADIVVADYQGNTGSTLTLLANTTGAPGTFRGPTQVLPTNGIGCHDALLRDLNGDGRLDIISSNYSSNSVSILLN